MGNVKMKALIDADIFQFEFGAGTDDEGKNIPLAWVQGRLQGRLDRILDAVNATSYQLYLTTSDKSNFRYEVATIQPYKGNRVNKEKPRFYQEIRNFIKDHRDGIEISGREADDAMCEAQWYNVQCARRFIGCGIKGAHIDLEELQTFSTTVICSRDKDLRMREGWHYSWPISGQLEKPMYWVTEIEGLKWFYSQMLMGDSTDHIPGLFGVGKSSSLIKHLNKLDNELELYTYVHYQYSKRFGTYALTFLEENARLLYMLKREGEVWSSPEGWQEGYEERLKLCQEKIKGV